MSARHYIVATAGHVDHGKSALVKALTGMDADRLPEEKARGITLELGFTHLQLTVPASEPLPASPTSAQLPAETSVLDVGLIDVPGHEDLVKNMVAGVGAADLALLVVAADDGWMPQSEEHLQILSYLGVRRAVVALTKIDLATDETAARQALRQHLQGSPYATAPIVATSVVTGRGLNELRQMLASALADAPPPPDVGKPRLAVDRSFTLQGIGTIVTGTLSGGWLRRGQSVVIQPGGRSTRIRGLQSHHREIEASGPGTRTALNLTDVDAVTEVHRGDVVTLPELGVTSQALDVILESFVGRRRGAVWDPDAAPRDATLASAANDGPDPIGATEVRFTGRPGQASTPGQREGIPPLKDRIRVRVHLGAANVPARLRWLPDEAALLPAGRALARLELETARCAWVGDRLVIRDASQQHTLAGGIVVATQAEHRPYRDPARVARLRERAAAPSDVAVYVRTEVAERGACPVKDLLRLSGYSAAVVAAAAAGLIRAGQAVPAGELLVDVERWEAWRRQGAELIAAHHQAHPELGALPLSELRSGLKAAQVPSEAFGALIAAWQQDGYVIARAGIRHGGHQPQLPPALREAGERVRRSLAEGKLAPPSAKELAPDAAGRKALRYLVEAGEAVEISPEVVLSREAFDQAVALISRHLRLHGRATVSELRLAAGTTRRVLVPLLEKLDADGLTRRAGDWRLLR
jgi:selenocysteine-specific elongation factor